MRIRKRQAKASNGHILEAWAIAVALIAYSNGLAVWSMRRSGDPEKPFRVLNPILTALLLLYVGLRPGKSGEAGIVSKGTGKSALWGLALGLGLSGPPMLFFYRPILLDTPLEYGPVARLSTRELAVELLVRMPFNVALLEELAFRGVLYGAIRRGSSAGAAIAGSAAAFAGWHATVTAASAAQTDLSSARLPSFLKRFIQPLSVVGGMLSTGIAGALFGLLRERTGSLLGPVVAHWTVDSLMVFSLWWRQRNSIAS